MQVSTTVLLNRYLPGLPLQLMNLSKILLVKGLIHQGYQAAGHLRSQLRIGNAMRRLFEA